MRRLFVITLLLAAAVTARADRHVTRAFSTSVPLRDIKRVVVEIPVGEISVTNGSGNQLSASGYIRREYDDDEERAEYQRVIDDISVEIYTSGNEAIVRRRFGPNARGWDAKKFATVNLDLEVPAGVDVEIATKIGEVTLEGSFGDVSTDLRAGEIRVRTPRANVKQLDASCRIGEVHASLGDRRITREGVFPGTTHFVNPDGGKGTMKLHTTVGEVHVTLTK